jgi:glycine cleavage system transcriptional repressor
MPHVAISAVGHDRPGIVAGVTAVLMEQGCNLEDTSMTILRGQFAMMLVVDVPDGVGPVSLEAALADVADAFDLTVRARTVDDDAATTYTGAPWTVVVYGADRPGIVHRVCAALAARGGNVVDLTTRVIGESEHPSYAMVLEITIPDDVDSGSVEAELAAVATELGVECTAHPSDADVF